MDVEGLVGSGRPTSLNATGRPAAVGVAAWCAVVAIAVIWSRIGTIVDGASVNAAPFYGTWAIRRPAGLIPAIVLAAAIATWWQRLAEVLRAGTLATVTATASCGWAVALAASDGWSRLHTPMLDRHGYASVARDIESPTRFIADFVDEVWRYPIHVKGHPPLMPVVLWALRAVGLEGSEWAAAAVIAAWGLGIFAVMVTVNNLGGIAVARRASAPVAFIPGVVWAATTPDALFFGVAAVSIALLVVSTGRRDRIGDLLGASGGAVAGIALHLTYGVLPLALLPIAIALVRRRARPLLTAAAGLVAVFVVFRAIGFWWFDGVDATRGFYEMGISRRRRYEYFVFAGNPAALLIGVGPVAAAGAAGIVHMAIRRVRSGGLAALMDSRRSQHLVLGVAAIIAVGVANLSGLSKAEVERIWLIFMPWIAIVAVAVWSPRSGRRWLVAQLAVGLGVQAILDTPW